MQYVPLPKFPVSQRDLTVTVPRKTEYAALEAVILRSGELLYSLPGSYRKVDLLSVYEGEKVQPGFKNMTFRLTFNAPDRSLTKCNIDVEMEKVKSALRQFE